jgi:hypothetical protein
VSDEAIVRTGRTLHAFGIAAFMLVLVQGESVQARRAPPQLLSAIAIDQAGCSDASPAEDDKSGDVQG